MRLTFLSLFFLIGVLGRADLPFSDALKASNAPLLWGPYRPNLYLGIRPQVPETLLMGLMWSNADDATNIAKNLRHTCEQNEGMTGYGWTNYDPRQGGSQVIHDTGNKIDLTTDFVKHPDDDTGGSWSLRVKSELRDNARKDQKTTVVFYFGSESLHSLIDCSHAPDVTRSDHHTFCRGEVAELHNFEINILPVVSQADMSERDVSRSVLSLQVARDTIWQAKAIFLDQLQHDTMLPNSPGAGNIHFVQVMAAGEFEIDVSFRPEIALSAVTSMSLTQRVQKTSEVFQERFRAAYQPQHPFGAEHYANFSKSLLSNVMGGIGYFYGTSKLSSDMNAEKAVLTGLDTAVEERGPYSLLSAVPSRPFFPRGFLWDEGFHLQVILDYDMDLALKILTNWLDLMDGNGWIAREQILGPEARSKVPPEFQTQYQLYANPPTLFMVVDMFLDRLLGHVPYNGVPSEYLNNIELESRKQQISKKQRLFLGNTYSKLKEHYLWFRRTQTGTLDKYQYLHPQKDKAFTEGYRWRGRTSDHILTSGLDDYPRAPLPSTDELHVDALCWVSLMAQVLQKLSSVLQDSANTKFFSYSKDLVALRTTAADIHWSAEEKTYCDATITPATSQIERVCHRGYISLLPFITNTIPNQGQYADHVAAALDLISDPTHLWSPYGLRSLSASDKFYGTGENYWRSPIWINMNYLVLVRLFETARQSGVHQDRARKLYGELRKNIVNTVFNSWNETGFAWEQYNPDTGKGQRTQHFTGWTSLIVRVMAMPNIDVDGEGGVWSPPRPGNAVLEQSRVALMSSSNLLFVVTLLFIMCVVFFRRRILRSWKRWIEDR